MKNIFPFSVAFVLLIELFAACSRSSKNHDFNNSLFLSGWKEKTLTVPIAVKYESQNKVNPDYEIRIDYSKKLSKISKYVTGINASTYTGDYLADEKLIECVKQLNPGIIRFPGGDASNMYFFDSLPDDLPGKALTYNGGWTDFTNGSDNLNWKMNTAKYYAFLDSVNSDGFITINYPYARYGTGPDPVSKAASLAANWVRFDKGRTKFWEIGNETYACWEGGFRIDTLLNKDGQPEYINGKLYGQHFRVFADSMRKAAKEIGSDIYIGAVFADDDDVWDGSGKNITKNWNGLLSNELRRGNGENYADFITVHNYFLNEGEKSPSEIINTSLTVPASLQSYIYKCLDSSDVKRVPMALTEWNIKEPRQTSQVGALQAVSTICRLNEINFGAACYFALKDYWRGEQGDFGIFSNNDPAFTQSEPYPTFYHFYFLRNTLGDEMIASEILPYNDSLLCYASSYSNGGIGIIVINKSLAKQSFKIDISNYRSQKTYYWFELSKFNDGNIWSEKLSINGHSNNSFSKGGPLSDYRNIPARTATTDNFSVMEIQGLSAMYFLVK